MYHDNPSSYEELIENAKLSFMKEVELEKILFDAVENQKYDDWQFAIKECHLQLKQIYISMFPHNISSVQV